MLTPSTHLLPSATALWAGHGYPQRLPSDRPTPLTHQSAGQGILALPFDALRVQYASAVMSGLAPRSLLASGQLERALDALETILLGPLARQR
jgi:hypothetical protein